MKHLKKTAALLAAAIIISSACSQPTTADTQNAASYIELAESYYDSGNIDKAIETLEDALKKTDSEEIRKKLSDYIREKSGVTKENTTTVTTPAATEANPFESIFETSITTAPAASVQPAASTTYTDENGFSISEDGGLSEYNGTSDVVVIPQGVTYIARNAFSNSYRYNIKSIIIPDSMTSIRDKDFSGFTSLTSITIPDSVTSIGEMAFVGCESLTSITIPESVTSIGENAFEGCESLTSITIPESVTRIEAYTFRNCTSLTSVTLPDSLTIIEREAFKNCDSLTSITIPDSVTRIEDWSFSNCNNLTNVNFPGNLRSLGKYILAECNNVNVNLPDSFDIYILDSYNYMFAWCDNATITYMGKTYTSIDELINPSLKNQDEDYGEE